MRIKKILRTILSVLKENKLSLFFSPKLLMTVFKLKYYGDGGYYHNVRLNDHYSTYSIGGKRTNAPLNDDNYSETLYKVVCLLI